jgi:hypothetical protein
LAQFQQVAFWVAIIKWMQLEINKIQWAKHWSNQSFLISRALDFFSDQFRYDIIIISKCNTFSFNIPFL